MFRAEDKEGVMKITLIVSMVALSFLAGSATFGSSCYHACGYVESNGSFSTLSYPSAVQTFLEGINDSGEIVGWYLLNGHNGAYGFSYSGGSFSPVDPPKSIGTVVTGVSNDGRIVGYLAQGGSFLDSGGSYTPINYPGALPEDTFAYGVNTNGDVVGYYIDPSLHRHGFWYSGGEFLSIDYPGAFGTFVTGINDSGEIVGWYLTGGLISHGFTEIDGVYSTIDYPGAQQTSLSGINDEGQILGQRSGPNPDGFLFDGNTFTLLGDYPGAVGSAATGLNDNGQIVGWYSYPAPEPSSFALFGSGALGMFGLIRKKLGGRRPD
jgi:uncharacterized membrane protein